MRSGRVLVVDDDPIECKSLSEFLRLEGYGVEAALSGQEALDKLRNSPFDVVLTDVNMPEVSGFDVLKEVNAKFPSTAVVLITGYGQIESAVEAIKLGAYDYITKPLIDDGVKMIIERALEQQMLKEENRELRRQLGLRAEFSGLVGRDHKMQKIYDLVEVIADTKATVLITGESGTGKTMVARTIHQKSSRREGPFVEVNCGALPETLLESELFGHTKGAFTGAVADKPGKFQLAIGGTVFLDEISVASPALQVKLLRVLQDKTFEKVGGNETITTDARVIIATNRDLTDEVEEGRFRQDLFYRINVVPLNVPPLRARVGDVKLLAGHFLERYARENSKEITGFHPDALRLMQEYSWPGNVRELENTVERAVILTQGTEIGVDDLPVSTREVKETAARTEERVLKPLREALSEPEKEIIEHALQVCGGSRIKAARALHINRSSLFKKMKQYHIEVPAHAEETEPPPG